MEKKQGCEYLVRAFAKVQEAVPAACLIIVGDGELRDQLQLLVLNLSVVPISWAPTRCRRAAGGSISLGFYVCPALRQPMVMLKDLGWSCWRRRPRECPS